MDTSSSVVAAVYKIEEHKTEAMLALVITVVSFILVFVFQWDLILSLWNKFEGALILFGIPSIAFFFDKFWEVLYVFIINLKHVIKWLKNKITLLNK